MRKLSQNVVILGAGAIGMSVAYHLAHKQFGKVIVLDKGPVGDGSSSRAAGIITGLLWNETGVRARKKSLELFRALSLELDGYRFRNVGCLNLMDQDSWQEGKKLLPLYERLGAPFEVLTPAEMRLRWPALHPPEDFLGLFDPSAGYSEPAEYIPALAKRITALGVEIREYEKVFEVLTRQGRVIGVRTARGDLEADAVVCTVHAWTLLLTAGIGFRWPIKCFVHQRYTSAPLNSEVQIPAVNINPFGGYIRPAAGNRLLAGVETPQRQEYRVNSPDFHMCELSVAPEVAEQFKHKLVSLLPDFSSFRWEGEKVGLIVFSMDGNPILGPVTGLPGFYIGTAFHSGGFAYGPVAGLLLAEFVADGRTSIDVSAFSPDRFPPGAVETTSAPRFRKESCKRIRGGADTDPHLGKDESCS